MMIYGTPIKEYIKNVVSGEFSHWPKWLWAANIFCIALGLWVIFWL